MSNNDSKKKCALLVLLNVNHQNPQKRIKGKSIKEICNTFHASLIINGRIGKKRRNRKFQQRSSPLRKFMTLSDNKKK